MDKRHRKKTELPMKDFIIHLTKSEHAYLMNQAKEKKIPAQNIIRDKLGLHKHLDCPTCTCNK